MTSPSVQILPYTQGMQQPHGYRASCSQTPWIMPMPPIFLTVLPPCTYACIPDSLAIQIPPQIGWFAWSIPILSSLEHVCTAPRLVFLHPPQTCSQPGLHPPGASPGTWPWSTSRAFPSLSYALAQSFAIEISPRQAHPLPKIPQREPSNIIDPVPPTPLVLARQREKRRGWGVGDVPALSLFPLLSHSQRATLHEPWTKANLLPGREDVAASYKHGTEGVFLRFSPLSQVSKPLS